MRPLERRFHQRVALNQLCDLHFPDLFNPVKATIIDLSAGGLRLRIPRIQEKHLAQAFRLQCSLGTLELRTGVHRLYSPSEHEIVVRFSAPGMRLHGELTKFVYSRLRRERDVQRVQAGAAIEATQTPRPEIRRGGVGVEGYYQSRGAYWLERRISTHLLD